MGNANFTLDGTTLLPYLGAEDGRVDLLRRPQPNCEVIGYLDTVWYISSKEELTEQDRMQLVDGRDQQGGREHDE
jgi:hypothetical protein